MSTYMNVQAIAVDKYMIWKNCPVEGCNNKVCLALHSDKCFVHTKGQKWIKLLKIKYNRLFK